VGSANHHMLPAVAVAAAEALKHVFVFLEWKLRTVKLELAVAAIEHELRQGIYVHLHMQHAPHIAVRKSLGNRSKAPFDEAPAQESVHMVVVAEVRNLVASKRAVLVVLGVGCKPVDSFAPYDERIPAPCYLCVHYAPSRAVLALFVQLLPFPAYALPFPFLQHMHRDPAYPHTRFVDMRDPCQVPEQPPSLHQICSRYVWVREHRQVEED
jgi:hypothetical protein